MGTSHILVLSLLDQLNGVEETKSERTGMRGGLETEAESVRLLEQLDEEFRQGGSQTRPGRSRACLPEKGKDPRERKWLSLEQREDAWWSEFPWEVGNRQNYRRETNPEASSKQIQRLGKSQKYATKVCICDD